MTEKKKQLILKISLLTLSPVLIILLWAIIAYQIDVPLILPMPGDVFRALLSLITTGTFWTSLGTSILQIYSGCLVGILIGVAVGLITYRSTILDTLLSPVFSVIRSTPVACFIILAWMFVGGDILPYYISMIMVAPVVMTGTQAGLRATSHDLLEAADMYHLSLLKKIRTCYLPALIPHLFSAIVNCIGLAWKAGIAAEIIVRAKEHTVGYQIWDAKSWNADPPRLFAWTIAIIIISLAFEYLFKWATKKIRKEAHT